MKALRSVAGLALAACLATLVGPTAPAAAQEGTLASRDAELQVVFSETSEGHPQIPVEGAFDYPDGTILYLTLRLADEESEHLSRKRAIVRSGEIETLFGPFRNRMLRGGYVVEAWFNVDSQPLSLRRTFLGEWGIARDYRGIVTRETREFGTPSEAAEDDRMILEHVRETYATIAEESEMIRQGARRALERRISPDDFMEFGQEHYEALNGIRDDLNAWQAGFLGLRHLDLVRRLQEMTHVLNDLLTSALHRLRAMHGTELSTEDRREAEAWEDRLAGLEDLQRAMEADLSAARQGDPSDLPGGGRRDRDDEDDEDER